MSSSSPVNTPPKRPNSKGGSSRKKAAQPLGIKMTSGRTHFSRAKGGKPFPDWLLYHRYCFDEWESCLVMEPSHVFGTKTTSANLRYWQDVSSIFKTISEAGIPLQELDLAGNLEVNSKTLAQASRLFGTSLDSIVLSGCQTIDKIALAFIGGMANLHSLDLSDIKHITDDDIERLIDKDLMHLHTLNVSGCRALTNRTLFAVGRTNHRFRSLSCAKNLNYTYEGVNDVMLKCESLVKFDLAFCPGVKHFGVIMHVGDAEHNIMQFAGRPLKVLKLNEVADLSPESLDYISGALDALTEVSLPRMKNLSDAMVQGIICGCFFLKSLHIPGCKNVKSEALKTIGRSARVLYDLNIANIGKFSPASLREMLSKCETLAFLNVSNNRGVTDKVFSEMEVPGSSGEAIFLPKMKRLSMANTSITAFGVACMAERCANIEHLDVSTHKYVNDAALHVIAGCCQKLKSLWLNDCPAVTDNGVIQVSYACKRLEVLHLSSSVTTLDAWGTRMKQFTDSVIEALLDGSRCLRELTMRNQCAIRLASPWLLTEFARRGGHQFLEKVDFRGADEINLRSAAVVFQQCSELCHVILSSESSMPGVESEDFWNSAFAGCMYTEAFNGTSASTALGENFDTEIERGRYSRDDGTGSLTTEVFAEVLSDIAAQAKRSKRDKARSRSPSPSKSESQTGLSGFGEGSMTSISTLGVGGTTLGGGLDEPSVASTNAAFSVSKRKGLDDNGSLASSSKILNSVIDDNQTSGGSNQDQRQPVPAGYLALNGHAERKSYRYRDFYIRRQLEEQSCARFIQFKYKLYSMWQRFRRRVSARRISNTYKVVLERRKLAILIGKLAWENSAKRIQRYFRNSKLPLVNASVKIQKIYRGHRCKRVLFRKAHEDWASVRIQAIIRGVLVRISERFILAQIYLKLPQFWRTIMNAVPKFDAADEAIRKRIFPYQIQEARDDVVNIQKHIIEDVVTGGVLKPQMALRVAQPFDKKPYLSLNNGQKIDYYSHMEGVMWNDTPKTTKRALERKEKQLHRLKYSEDGTDLFKAAERARKNGSTVENMNLLLALKERSEKEEDAPMHQFNIKFWPHTTPMHSEDLSTEQHDPMINSFDIANNSREVLFCESCRTRFRIVHCDTCMRGYCFFCAFRTHTDVSRRNHRMHMQEPRVIKIQEASKSLVYHVDMAQNASYDLKYLVKYMRSRAEVQRLQAEKRMAKEYEEQEEARRMQFLRAQGESNDKQIAATDISLLYRTKRARKIVKERREQLELERVTKEDARQKVCWIPFQKLFRQYSTRKWFAEKGVVYKLYRKKKKKRIIKKADTPDLINAKDLRERINYEIRQRRITARMNLFSGMLTKYAHLITTLKTNIAFWLERNKSIPEEIESYAAQKEVVSDLHEEQSQVTAAQKGVLDPNDYEKLERRLDATYKRVECAHSRLENAKNSQWWIMTYLRSAYRRLGGVQQRLQDTAYRLEWVTNESAVVSRIEAHVIDRIELMKAKLGMGMAVDWLQRYLVKIQRHMATLDAQQESLLLEETQRIVRDEHTTVELDSLLQELYQGMTADSHMLAEKVHLDVVQTCDELPIGSEEALRTSDSLVTIKRKLTQLNNSVIDTIKIGLQSKLNEEEDRNNLAYVFPTDDPELTVEQFTIIEAQLLNGYSHPKHVTLNDFLDIYLAQPWLAEQAVGDVRLEEEARKLTIERGKALEERKGIQNTIDDNDKKSILLRKNINELKVEIETRSEVPNDENGEETDFEKEERENLVGMLSNELFKKEGELDVCQEVNAKVRDNLQPLQVRADDLEREAASKYEHIKKREEERNRLRELFFDAEIETNSIIFENVAKRLEILEKELLENEKRNLVFKAASAHEPFLERVLNDELSLMERNCLNIPTRSVSLHLMDCLKIAKPSTGASSSEYVQANGATRLLFGDANYNCLAKLKELLESEEEWMNSFTDTVPTRKKAVELFAEALLSQRRQKALQVEIEARKKRLEFLREMRMRALKEQKEKVMAEMEQKEETKRKAKENSVPLSKQIAVAAKAVIRGAKDFVREIRHSAATAMDQEEVRMARKIRAASKKDDSSMPEAIRKLHITHGIEETEQFGKLQEAMEDRGIPFFEKMPRSFGNQYVLWYQNTFDNRQMITNLEFGHVDPEHPLYKDEAAMRKDSWEPYTHHSLDMIFYVKRDVTKIFALKGFELSLSEAEENRNTVDGFEKLETCLDKFGLPDMYFWAIKVPKIAHSDAQNTDEVINEVLKVRELLAKKPGDKNMQALMKRLNDKLRVAYEKEASMIVVNPLRSAVELLSLTPQELEEWLRVFAEVDTEKEGSVDMDQIFEYFEQTPTFYSKEIFYSVDALDETGKIEFGDFIRAIGTYCFFGKQEILKFMFKYSDKGKKGFITHAEFVTLLNTLNPFEKQRAKRALNELQMVEGKEMNFEEFARMNEEFPNTMHPAFQLQNAFRTKILGDDWWFDKLSKYKGVRTKLMASAGNTDEIAELEMKRFQEDEAKSRRMKHREEQIRNEPSAIRKAILQAQQMVDEFS